MNLETLLTDCDLTSPLLEEWRELPVSGLQIDSRKVKSGDVFIAVKGTDHDGNDFIDMAVEKGAIAVITERNHQSLEVPCVRVLNDRLALSKVAANFASSPSADLAAVGITGTNGKTTTAFLIDYLLKSKFRVSGLMGTVTINEGKCDLKATHTTADPIALHQSLKRMKENGCYGVTMEVSSHGLHQGRVKDVLFNTGVFTNLTQDHLDYHRTMEAYYQAKKLLFVQLAEQKSTKKPTAVINIDDAYGERLYRELSAEFPDLKIITTGQGVQAQFRASNILQTVKGLEFQLDYNGKSYLVKSGMIGLFNVKNILSALATTKSLKLNLRDCIKDIENAPQVPGRLERVNKGQSYTVFVDYAHTPDALENVCATLKDVGTSRLLTVFGCGGDRDKTKRPEMARVASDLSNHCFITSDNPRTEDPEAILKEVEKGISRYNSTSFLDRKEAITAAIDEARKNDIVLIAGKGHENYQIFADETIHFDDREEARIAVQTRSQRERAERREAELEDLKNRKQFMDENPKPKWLEDEHDIERRERDHGER